ncbi:MAG TPA: xanthine dehydrogenase family protein subunit M [Candidatus Dormibacteraeota bacterium]
MIPAPFEYVRATSLDHASALLTADEDAKALAGGMSLIPLLRLRLARPTTLIDLGPLRGELAYVRDEGAYVAIGALTRHHDLATSATLRTRIPLLAHVASLVGDPQVRHRGTLGGSVAHADPAADLPAVLSTLEAGVVVQDGHARRELDTQSFFQGFLETALRPGELVVEVRIPVPAPGHGWAYTKFNRRAQDWAIVAVAAIVERSGESITRAAVGLANMASTAVRATGVERALAGGDATGIAPAADHATEGTSPVTDLGADAAFRRHLARTLSRRTVHEAYERAAA